MKNFKLLLACLTIFTLPLAAQTTQNSITQNRKDSLEEAYLADLAIKYPLFRQGFLSTDVLGSGNTNAQLYGQPLFKGKIRIIREQGNFNVPIVNWGKNSFIGSVNFQNQHFEITPTHDFNKNFPIKYAEFDKAVGGAALTFTRRDSLFNAPVTYHNTISGYSDAFSSIKRVNYQGSIIFLIRHNETSSLSLGVAVIIDPSTPSPVLPVVYYWHKYDNDFELFVDIPSRVSIRRQIASNLWASLGSQISGSFLFFNVNVPGVPQNDTYATFELKTGPSLELLVSKKIILSASGGIFSTLTSHDFQQHTNPDNYFIKNNNSSVPYANFTISFLPFFRTSK